MSKRYTSLAAVISPQIGLTFLTFWILLSYLVPISLFVTLEIVKFWQVGAPPVSVADPVTSIRIPSSSQV